MFSLLFYSCNKDIAKTEESKTEEPKVVDLNIFNGTYTGFLTVQYISETKTGATTLVLDKGKYTCSGNFNTIPAGGSGTFFAKGDTITFNVLGGWTANFDANLVLHGKYKYTLDGNKLTLLTVNTIGQYKYNLGRN